MSNDKEQRDKLLKLVRDTLQEDKDLREKLQIGDKFRFIRDRLTALLSRVEESISALEKETEKKTAAVADDEVVVYVYLYNAQGIVLKTWQKMLNPAVFYEYSVNRPIYEEKALVESFIRSRPNKVQHGFLAIAVNKQSIIHSDAVKDAIGNPLIKVREGSLHINRLLGFVHNGHEYEINNAGELEKKI